jgi:hypothetical protein
MNTGVQRIVTTGYAPVVTMRVGADHWRSNAGTIGAGGVRALYENMRQKIPVRVYRILRAWAS